MQVVATLGRALCALGRYFFVRAPSREEAQKQMREESSKMHQALGRLDSELVRLEGALRAERRHGEVK